VGRRVALVLLAVAALSTVAFVIARSTQRATADPSIKGRAADAPDGRQIFLRDCAICHGNAGQGTARAPDIRQSGVAAVDFMIRTGRMPLRSPDEKLERRAPKYDEAEIKAIDAYAATILSGPAIPTVSIDHADISNGQKLYQSTCAACHQAAGSGGALAYGTEAPPLSKATPLEVVEAMRIGPGTMPRFDPTTVDADEARDVAAYVNYLHAPEDPGGIDLEHLGPVPEGLVAWIVGLGALILITRMLGVRVHRSKK
jgi:ubiquinol-cytochrome c reductase cytochrome c subunit